jgi:thymidylate synthase
MGYTPFNVIESNNFHNAWVEAVKFVLQHGAVRTFGGPEYKNGQRTGKFEQKHIKDSRQIIFLKGEAIQQILRGEMHPQFPWTSKKLAEYCREFDWPYLEYYKNLPTGDKKKFDYIYFDRLVNPINQLKYLKENLAEQREHLTTSNRCQAITWQPEIDTATGSPPCLQRVQIRWITEYFVEVETNWRSRDLYTALQSNMNCEIRMLNREVLEPNDLQIQEIIDYSTSLHIHFGDMQDAKKVKPVAINPQTMR